MNYMYIPNKVMHFEVLHIMYLVFLGLKCFNPALSNFRLHEFGIPRRLSGTQFYSSEPLQAPRREEGGEERREEGREEGSEGRE